ncbi:hypothetical protein B0H63DRAFT_471169 [Podospora didyma]|uniref:Uncharacterized protein n=1 Tax=Podospora didyma TaxID=330526 RepID=A0AAE0NUD8_9PEZI|nr:hypothetical protein B0H63DRAFT_471169 [Podospora didyma]
MAMAPNCSAIPDQVPSDPGIAGAAVLLSSTITAGLTIGMSASLVLQGFVGRHDTKRNPSLIRRKLLNSYSDQQIIVGIGIQSVGLVKAHQMVAYHFFIIWMLSLLSMATHNATLLALVHDFRRDWVLRWLRQFLMFVNLALSCVLGVYVLESKIRGLPNTLPIGCVWSIPESSSSVNGIDYVGTIVTIAGNCVIFGLATWYLHNRKQRFYKVVQLVGLVLMAGIAIGATARAYLLSQAFGKPDVSLSDQGEKSWSFGQLLSMLMLILPVISVIEIIRGEIAVAPPVADSDDDDNESNEEAKALFRGQVAEMNAKTANKC